MLRLIYTNKTYSNQMEATKVYLILALFLISSINGDTLDFFSLCGNTEVYIADVGKTAISLHSALDWPTSSNTCTVIFQSYGIYNLLYFSFQSFILTDFQVKIQIDGSLDGSYYSASAKYYRYMEPVIDYRILANKYMKVNVTRERTDDDSLDATFEVYTENYYNNLGKTSGYNWRDTVRIIVGSVFGVIAFILIMVVIIVCCVFKSRSKVNNSPRMVNGIQKVIGDPTSTMSPGLYPRQAPPGNYAMHPTYPQTEQVGYPVQPGAHPSNAPAYTALPVVHDVTNSSEKNVEDTGPSN